MEWNPCESNSSHGKQNGRWWCFHFEAPGLLTNERFKKDMRINVQSDTNLSWSWEVSVWLNLPLSLNGANPLYSPFFDQPKIGSTLSGSNGPSYPYRCMFTGILHIYMGLTMKTGGYMWICIYICIYIGIWNKNGRIIAMNHPQLKVMIGYISLFEMMQNESRWIDQIAENWMST